MKKCLKNICRCVCVVGFLTLLIACQKTIREIPIGDFFRSPSRAHCKISPEGGYVAFMAPYKECMNLFVQIAGDTTQEPLRITQSVHGDISDFFWKNENKIFYVKDSAGDKNFRLYGVNVDGSERKVYTPRERCAKIIDVLPGSDSLIFISLNDLDSTGNDAYRLNIYTGERMLEVKNPGGVQEWKVDHQGQIRLAFGLAEDGSTRIYYRDTVPASFRAINTISYEDLKTYVLFAPDNKSLYLVSYRDHDKTSLIRIDPNSGTVLETLYTPAQYDISQVVYSERFQSLTDVLCRGHKENIRYFLNKEAENIYKKIQAQVPKNMSLFLVSATRDEKKWVVRTCSDKDQGAYYLYEVGNEQLIKISEVAPWIKAKEMCDVIPVVYTSRDEMQIESYLTLPYGIKFEDAQDLPVVIYPHKGPWDREDGYFNAEVQLLANRGYAVFQMNYRGSTGYGKKFLRCSFKEWGQNMQNDITDGVNWLIEKKIADPARVAIYGRGYGGYAALMGLIYTPTSFACGVVYDGYPNLLDFLKKMFLTQPSQKKFFSDRVGDPLVDGMMLRAISPIYHLDSLKAPLLMVRSSNSSDLLAKETDRMVNILHQRSFPVTYEVQGTQGKKWDRELEEIAFYKEMLSFLRKNLRK